jgi:hypothetical protein
LWRFNDFKFPDRKVRQPTVRKTPPILQQLGTLDNLPLSPVQNVMWEPLATDSAALVDKIAVVDQSQLKLYSLANKGTVLEPVR